MLIALRLTKARRMQDVTKWQKWYNNQNEATKVWLDARAAEDTKFALVMAAPALVLGIVIGLLFGIGI